MYNKEREPCGDDMRDQNRESGDRHGYHKKSVGGGAYLSIWALLAKSSFYKILALLLAMAVVEAGWFYGKRREIYAMSGSSDFNMRQIFYNNKISFLFLAVLGLTFFILFWTENRLEGNGKYTIMRLRATGRQFFVIKTIYNVLCLVMIFTVQICLVFWMIWKCKADMNLGQNAPQIYFFAFYSNRFLHCLLPMADTGKWVRNGLLVLAWGMQAAGMKRKGGYIWAVCLFVVEAYWFESDMGVSFPDIECCVLNIVIIAKEVFDLKYKKLA